MKKQAILILSLISTSVLFLGGCSKTGDLPVSRSGLYYDTIIGIDLYGAPEDEAQKILDDCMKMCEHYGSLFDKNTKTSDIAKINSSAGVPVKVDHNSAVLISEALEYSVISGGKFDITIEPVSRLWDFHSDEGAIPKDKDIKEALSKVGYKNISVDAASDTVTAYGGSSIDLGASAKGYIADKLAEYLSSCNITGAIINMGGDMRLVGKKPSGSLFSIGINDPSQSGSVALPLYLSDMSVATSGTYERCFTVDGKRYHHILDPDTGYPVDSDIESVTVITKSALDSDCLCTVSLLLGSEEAKNLIENTADTDAIFILTDGKVIKTSGADKYIRQ